MVLPVCLRRRVSMRAPRVARHGGATGRLVATAFLFWSRVIYRSCRCAHRAAACFTALLAGFIGLLTSYKAWYSREGELASVTINSMWQRRSQQHGAATATGASARSMRCIARLSATADGRTSRSHPSLIPSTLGASSSVVSVMARRRRH